MRKAFQDIAQRLVQAEENFIASLMELGGITRAEATRVCDLYRREKLIKRDAVGGVYNVKHGAFLDRDVIRRALAETATRSGGKRRSTPFATLTRKLAARGSSDPKALAAWIGRKQVGQAEMTRRAVKGKAKKRRGGKKRHAPSFAALVRRAQRRIRSRRHR